jgi:hypothetical protein
MLLPVLSRSLKIAPCLNPSYPSGIVSPSASRIKSSFSVAVASLDPAYRKTLLSMYGLNAVRKEASAVVLLPEEIACTFVSLSCVDLGKLDINSNVAISLESCAIGERLVSPIANFQF